LSGDSDALASTSSLSPYLIGNCPISFHAK
jgi:hypothetical protein